MQENSFEYLVQDPGLWVQFAINIALSFLGLFVYIVFKVYKIAAVIEVKKFLIKNKPFWLWHFLASLAVSLVSFFAPESLIATLTEFGIALKEDASFMTIGLALATMAYGEKKKEMLEDIEINQKLAERAKAEL